jgi:hypothetical protein
MGVPRIGFAPATGGEIDTKQHEMPSKERRAECSVGICGLKSCAATR